MAESEDNSWVLDSLVGLLNSPVWQLAIYHFVDQRSVVFEPEEEHEEEYRKIFEDFRDLVDKLLGSHMEDLGITADQFELACQTAHGVLSAKFHQALFEQIWAANDYDIFKRMMIQRNIELQLQALEILAQRYGLVPESFLPDGTSQEDFLQDGLLDAVLKRSLDESESDKAIEDAIKELQLTDTPASDPQRMELPEQPPTVQMMTPQPPQDRIASAIGAESRSGGFSAEDIKRRTEYLKRQRDKLIEVKRKDRQKQIEKLQESQMLTNRPKSAKALASVVLDEDSDEEDGQEEHNPGLAFRKSLAARLKAEIIDKEQSKK